MYFQCSCAVFCEDSVGEGIDPSAFIYPDTNLWNPSGIYSLLWEGQRHQATWLSRTIVDDPFEHIDTYSRLLTQFSGRQISDPRDVIASFEGILPVLGRSLKTDFWFGLPEKYLDETLLWVEAGPSLRRNISITPSSGLTFPSWSWAGWDTAVELVFIFIGDIWPEVEWFVINQGGEAFQLVTPGSYNASVSPPGTRNVRPTAGPLDDFLKTVQHRAGISESRKRELPRFLACWTCIALFGIGDRKVEVDGDLGPEWDFKEHLPVLDKAGHWAGSLFIGQGWEIYTKGNSRRFEFMLLSRSSSLNGYQNFYDAKIFTSRE